ncbi:hypothetical protein ACIOTI_32130 [Streptomyces sp. NPDC087843]|uniref:hypothetical protein n=1 Tax=Streptomyces sp. NPDC087843 TaxID=3365804 RepID=UPI0037FE15DD
MDDMQVPEALVTLQSAAYVARVSLADYVRAHGPVRDWADETRVEAASLQQTLESAEIALRQAFEARDLLRHHTRRSLRLALLKEGKGKLRCVVEQTFALLDQVKRLAVRWKRRTELCDDFGSLACGLNC